MQHPYSSSHPFNLSPSHPSDSEINPNCLWPNPSLSIPTLLGGPATGPPFPARHPMGLGPSTLLGSLENHLPLSPLVLPTPAGTRATPGDLLLAPAQPGELEGLGALEGQRQVFVRYDKEEPEDVEISLESDSDDSVVIMPVGMMMEMQDGAANVQSLSQSAVPALGGLQPSAPIVGEIGSFDALPNELPTSIPHQILPANANNINSFPGPSQTALLVSSGASSELNYSFTLCIACRTCRLANWWSATSADVDANFSRWADTYVGLVFTDAASEPDCSDQPSAPAAAPSK